MFTGAVFGFLAASLQEDSAAPMPVRVPPLDFLLRYYREAAAVQACLSVFVAFIGWMLVRRRPWASVIVQLLSALVIAWIVIFGIYWLRGLGAITSTPGYPPAAAVMVRILMGVGGVVAMATLAFAFGLCIWVLSLRAVREELRSRAAPARE